MKWCISFALVFHLHAQSTAARLQQLADRFVQQELDYDPTLSETAGLATRDHSRLANRTAQALAAFDQQERDDLKALRTIPLAGMLPADRATYANLLERLESDLQLRVCKAELWNVNHFDGWASQFADVANRQPIATAEDRQQALKRWSSLPAYVSVEIANLKRGLSQGYSAPQSVVGKVTKQMDNLVSSPLENSPFYSPARRSGDRVFQAAVQKAIEQQINPALIRYRDFLRNEYLPQARTGVAISDLPNGSACYQAFLRVNTTLPRTPQEVFDLGRRTVAVNTAEALELGRKNFGTSDVSAILAAIKAKPDEHFHSKEELLAFSRKFLEKAKRATEGRLIARMPQQDIIIQAQSPMEEAAGVSSRYVEEPDDNKPGIFFIQLQLWPTQTRSEAEITTVHEAWPGHHLQKALAHEIEPPAPLSKLIDNSAYSEGWARYAEGMAEEIHIYDRDDVAILRRLWPARGMVLDPGLHALHWTREQAINYIVASGRYTRQEADDYVDRIAVMPGQLTSYDSGGLEIQSLRRNAEAKLGTRFDLRRFNYAVLSEGIVPLSELRRHIEEWIAEESRR